MNYFFTFINVVALALLGYIIYQQIEEHKYYDKDNIIIEEVVATTTPVQQTDAQAVLVKPSTEATDTPTNAQDVVEETEETTASVETPEVPAVGNGDEEEIVEKVTEDEE